jgi:hypothetical protein
MENDHIYHRCFPVRDAHRKWNVTEGEALDDELKGLVDLLKVKPGDVADLDPSLQQLRRADFLVKTPLYDPLTSVIEGEAYDIAKIDVLTEIFTLPTKDASGKDVIYGGLPAVNAGVKRLINILPAIEGKRAGQFVDAIKPAQPNIPVEMPREEKEGWIDKIKGLIFGRHDEETQRNPRAR